MHSVYIIYSQQLDRFYVGESGDPVERLEHHIAGDQRYTRRATDWVLVFHKQVSDRSEALRIERQIKQSKSRKSIVRWIHQTDNLIDPQTCKAFFW
jgi:putative endonuclease